MWGRRMLSFNLRDKEALPLNRKARANIHVGNIYINNNIGLERVAHVAVSHEGVITGIPE